MQNNFNGRTSIGQQNDFSNNNGQINNGTKGDVHMNHSGDGDIVMGDKSTKTYTNHGNLGFMGDGMVFSGSTFTQNNSQNNVDELKNMIKELLSEIEKEATIEPQIKEKLTKTLNTTAKNIENKDKDNLEGNVDVLENINGKLASASKTVGHLAKIIASVQGIYLAMP